MDKDAPHGADEAMELDRIIPSLGYIEGNVRLVSSRANQIKSNATLDELRALLSEAEFLHKILSECG